MASAVRASQVTRQALHDGEGVVRVAQLAREVLRDGAGTVRVAQASRQALHAGAGAVRVSGLFRSILRTVRDSPWPNFPSRLFRNPVLGVRLAGGAVSGTTSLGGGDEQVAALAAGGVWQISFGEGPLWDRDDLLAWRNFVAAADLGPMPCVVPLWDRRFQPFDDAKYTGSTSFGRVIWRDTPVWDAEQIAATVSADAARQADQIAFTYAGGQPLVGGEHFSIYGPRFGWRLYRLLRQVSDVAGVLTWQIAPPLREWLGAGTALNFDSPRLTMRPEGDLSEIVEKLRFGRGGAVFVESFNRYP